MADDAMLYRSAVDNEVYVPPSVEAYRELIARLREQEQQIAELQIEISGTEGDALVERDARIVAEHRRAEKAEARVRELDAQLAKRSSVHNDLTIDFYVDPNGRRVYKWHDERYELLRAEERRELEARVKELEEQNAGFRKFLGQPATIERVLEIQNNEARLAVHRVFVVAFEEWQNNRGYVNTPEGITQTRERMMDALREVKRVDPDPGKFTLLKGKAYWVHDEEPT